MLFLLYFLISGASHLVFCLQFLEDKVKPGEQSMVLKGLALEMH